MIKWIGQHIFDFIARFRNDVYIESDVDAKPTVTISSGGTSQGGGHINFKRTATGANNQNLGDIYFIGKNDADEDITYAQINGDIQDASDGAEEGEMVLRVASHDGELQPGLTIVSGNVEDEVDATIGNGTASRVTVPGKLSIGERIEFDSLSITGIQAAAEAFSDDDVSLMTSAAIDDRINAAGGGGADGWHGSTSRIKLLHRDFIADDSGRPLLMDDTGAASENFFLESNASAPMYATVAIPTGFKATHVMVYGSATDAVEVWEHQINSKTGVSKGTGNVDTEFAITNVTSSATNYLFIQVANASGNEVHGGYVTIAAV